MMSAEMVAMRYKELHEGSEPLSPTDTPRGSRTIVRFKRPEGPSTLEYVLVWPPVRVGAESDVVPASASSQGSVESIYFTPPSTPTLVFDRSPSTVSASSVGGSIWTLQSSPSSRATTPASSPAPSPVDTQLTIPSMHILAPKPRNPFRLSQHQQNLLDILNYGHPLRGMQRLRRVAPTPLTL